MEYCDGEGVVRVSWQPVVVAGGDQVEYTVKSWKDGAGDPAIIYQLVSFSHTHTFTHYGCGFGM